MNPDLIAAKHAAWAFFSAGWQACVDRAGGFMINYCGSPTWDLIAREEFEAFIVQELALWEEENMAKAIKHFNQVFVEREAQPLPTPDEATHPGRYSL